MPKNRSLPLQVKEMKPVHIVITIDSMNVLDSASEISFLNDSKFYLSLKICTGCNDNTEASYSCLECKDTLCELCYQAHLKVKLTLNHTLSQLPLK